MILYLYSKELMMIRFTDKYPRVWRVIVCMGFVIVAGLSEQACVSADKAVKATAAQSGKKPINPDMGAIDASEASVIEERWGVKLQGVQISAAGHMLDFRFWVTDPNKAAPLLDKKNKASAIIEENNVKLEVPNVPRIGSLRQTSKQVKEGMRFTILFANPGKMVATGQKLTVRIGDFSVEHITVGDILNTPPKHERKAKHE
jgi:hypothetical protein